MINDCLIIYRCNADSPAEQYTKEYYLLDAIHCNHFKLGDICD